MLYFTDPLLRDTLRWRRVRYVLWGLILAAEFSILIIVLFAPPGSANALPPLSIFIFLLSPIYVDGVAGLVALPLRLVGPGIRFSEDTLAGSDFSSSWGSSISL